MNETTTDDFDQINEDMLNSELADETLEAAAGSEKRVASVGSWRCGTYVCGRLC